MTQIQVLIESNKDCAVPVQDPAIDCEIIEYLLVAKMRNIPGMDWQKKYHQCKISKLISFKEAYANLADLLVKAKEYKTEIEFAMRELEENMCSQDAAKRKL